MVQQALVDYARIKSGLTRREVEKYFMQQGGVQFPGSIESVVIYTLM
jgi:hypothetical protein